MHGKHGGPRAIFLDRDGVLTISEVVDGKPYAPHYRQNCVLYSEATRNIARLKQRGFLLIVVTNQPDVGNGLVDRAEVEAMNANIAEKLALDAVKVCFHAQGDGCDCRKPQPGMLLEAAREYGIDLANSFMIGDRKGDIQAGYAVGCRTIFIDRGYRESEQPCEPELADIYVTSLEEAVNEIIALTSDSL